MEWLQLNGVIIMNDVLKFYKENMKENQTVIAAISGGPDSMALLHSLLEYHDLKIVVAHVNHKMRVESEKEEHDLKEYCKKHHVIFECMHLKKKDKENFQMYAREERIRFFESLAKKYQTPYILTAHHADDLMETILMRMVRGSSLKGYSGFSKITNKGDYIYMKPLIEYTKEELLNYVKENHIPYAVDQSNQKDTYTRNRYRKQVLPFLKEENPNVHHKFYQFHQELEECDSYFEDLLANKDFHKILIKEFQKEHPYMQKRWIQKYLEEYYQEKIYKLDHTHINLLRSFLLNGKTNTYLVLPGKIKAVKTYDSFYLTNSKKEDYCMELQEKNKIPNTEDTIQIVKKCEVDNNYICRLSFNNITLPIFIRNRKVGDRMEVKGLNGTKSVSDIFTNSKVPLLKRDTYPILVDSKDQVLWIPGLKKSKFDKTKTEKYDIILKYEPKGVSYE